MDSTASLIVRARRLLAGGLVLVATAPGAWAETFDLEPIRLGLGVKAACGVLVLERVPSVLFTNHGPDDVTLTLGALIYQDLDGDGEFDAGSGDALVQRFSSFAGLAPPGRVSGVRGDFFEGFLPYPEMPMSVELDPDGLLAESDETNNVLRGVYACSVVEDGTVPAPDFAVALLSVRVEQTADCGVVAILDCRAANLGSTSAGGSIETWALVDGVPTLSLDLPDLAPTETTDFTFEVPFEGQATLSVTVNGDGAGGLWPDECQDYNNRCDTEVDEASAPPVAPEPLGPFLRATQHGDPHSLVITGNFDWSLDPALPRPADDHYHVYQSLNPEELNPVDRRHPSAATGWISSTLAGTELPTVHFIKVSVADGCEHEAD